MSKSNYIRDRRLEMGISQTQLAQRTGISRQRISDYEARRYRPCEQTMEKLARILGPDLTKVPVLPAAAQKVTRPRPATVPFEAVFAATWVRFSIKQLFWRRRRWNSCWRPRRSGVSRTSG